VGIPEDKIAHRQSINVLSIVSLVISISCWIWVIYWSLATKDGYCVASLLSLFHDHDFVTILVHSLLACGLVLGILALRETKKDNDQADRRRLALVAIWLCVSLFVLSNLLTSIVFIGILTSFTGPA